MEIKWLGHASFRIETAGKIIHLDPYIIPKRTRKADLILVSNDHYDHCNIENIERLRKKKTVILTTEKAAELIQGNVQVMNPGDEVDYNGIKIRAIPAYNLKKPFHPKGMGLGFIMESEGKRIYHAGDTDLIPEMETLEGITVALLPVGGTYTMDVKEASEAVRMINPRIAVPMHYGEVVGSKENGMEFKKRVEENMSTVSVLIPKKEGITL